MHTIHLTDAQHKKLQSAHKARKAYTVQFEGDQANHQGAGLLQDVYNYVKRTPYIRNEVNSGIRAGKTHSHRGVNYLSSKAHSKINSIPYIEGHGIAGSVLNGGASDANLIEGPGSKEAADILRGVGDLV